LRTSAAITLAAHAALLALVLAHQGGAPPDARGVDIRLVDRGAAPAPARAPAIPFGPGMEPPRLLSGRDPAYTPEALAARVQGAALVECVITTEGALTGCRVLRSIPHMDQAILEAMATRRYAPVTSQGRPVAVSYVFQVDLVLPD
jgi:TonB family protein